MLSACPVGRADNDVQKCEISVSNEVLKNTTRLMYGANFEWGGEENIYLKDNLEINPEFVLCLSGNAPFNRMAGTSANNFYWKKAVGSLYSRSEQTMWGQTKIIRFGPVEWINSVRSADADAKFIYTINLNDTENNIADLAEFLTGDGSVNYNGGLNWAQKRAEYGMSEPVQDIIWELGNELDLCDEELWSVDKYVQKARAGIEAIRSVDPEAKFACHASTYATELKTGWENWHRTVLRELGDDISYISMHYYYPTSGSFSNGEAALETVMSDITEITGRDDIRIIFTENASAAKAGDSSSENYRYPHTMAGTLATAEFYLRMLSHPEVVAANYHSINSSSWALCYVEDGKVKPTAILKLQKLFAQKLCGTALQTDVSGDGSICAGAVTDGDRLCLAVINKSSTDTVTVSLNLGGAYEAVSKNTISASRPGADLYTGFDEITCSDEEIGEELSEVRIPPLSVNVFEYKREKAVCEFKEKFLTGELGFHDGCITAASLDTLSDGMESGHIIGDKNGNSYRAAAANNMLVWEKSPGGGYEKRNAGIDGFYGYFNNLQTDNVLTKDTAQFLSVLNTGSDGVLQMRAQGDSGYCQYTSFGKYDLDISGLGVLNAKIGICTNSPGEVKLELVQRRKKDSDAVGAAIEILRIDRDNNLYFYGNDEPVLKLDVMRFSNVSQKRGFVTVRYASENSGESLKCSLKLFNSEGKLLASAPAAEVDMSRYTGFDPAYGVGGFKFTAKPSGWMPQNVFMIDELDYCKRADRTVIENNSEYERTVVYAEYDGQSLVSAKIMHLQPGESIDGMCTKEGAKYIAFESTQTLRPAKVHSLGELDGEVIVIE